MPKISVLMSVHNDEQYLNAAIESIIFQTYANFQFIIINDASTDNSFNIINSYDDERIIKINNKKKLGLTKSLNIGLNYANGEFIARMDADDISKTDRFEKQIIFLKKNETIDAVGGQKINIDHNEKMLKPNYRYPLTDELIKWELYFEVPFCHPTIMIRKNIFKKIGSYNENYLFAQDFEFWKRMVINNCTLANLDDEILYYRKVEKRESKWKKRIQNKLHLRVLADYLSYNGFMIKKDIVKYFRYCSKKSLTNNDYIIKSIILLLNIQKSYLFRNNISYASQEIINQTAIQKIINTVKYQNGLPIVTRLQLLAICLGINHKAISNYQLRSGLKSIFKELIRTIKN